jgi:hypothetical protein
VHGEYGQDQPNGSIALGAGSNYSFGVPLFAALNGDDQNRRTFTIVVMGINKRELSCASGKPA